MSRFYTVDELRGCMVVDCMGLIYGYVHDYKVEGDRLLLVVTVKVRSSERVVDVEELRRRLREAGADAEAASSVEEVVEAARSLGIEIPYRRAGREYEMVKGLVDVREVKTISDAVVGGKRVCVVLLSTPREARYRGYEPPSPRLDSLVEARGRLVVSQSRGVLGYFHEIVVGPGQAGLRVVREERGYVNWIGFTRELRRRGMEKAYAAVVEKFDPLLKPRLPLDLLEELKRLVRGAGGEEAVRLLESFVVREAGGYMDIAWSEVVRIGDVILVR